MSKKRSEPVLASRKGILFHQCNAQKHTMIVAQQKLNDLGQEVLICPPYSPGTAPSDHLLAEHCRYKDLNFYARETSKLPERWQRAVANHGNYTTKLSRQNNVQEVLTQLIRCGNLCNVYIFILHIHKVLKLRRLTFRRSPLRSLTVR